MSNMVFTPKWNEAINQLERNEFATGGANGNMNIAPRQLAENIWFLRDKVDGFSDDIVKARNAVPKSEKGAASGVASLGLDGKVPLAQLPDVVGSSGKDAVISGATASTGAAGTSAMVTLSGTPSDRVFNFVIPKGDKGDKGDKGADGTAPNFYPNTTTEPPNTYVDSFGTLKRSNNFLNAASRKVGKGADELVAYDYEGGFGEIGYIKAGFNAPKLAFMKVTGYLNNSTSTSVSPPVDFSKIIGVQIFAKAEGYWYTGHDVSATNVLTISLISAGLFIKHGTRMQGAEYKILITYEV